MHRPDSFFQIEDFNNQNLKLSQIHEGKYFRFLDETEAISFPGIVYMTGRVIYKAIQGSTIGYCQNQNAKIKAVTKEELEQFCLDEYGKELSTI